MPLVIRPAGTVPLPWLQPDAASLHVRWDRA